MAKSFLSIVVITLLFGANIALGQENNPTGPSFYITTNKGDTNSFLNAVAVTKTSVLQKLSSEELDQIIGKGVGDILTATNDHISSVPWIILWDEISKQRNASAGGNIEVISNGSFMNGVRMNSSNLLDR